MSIVPHDLKRLRACFVCSLVKTEEQFYTHGCNNCDFLGLQGQRSRVAECTTPNFDGMIARMAGETSWVSRWQRIVDYKPGCYAVTVKDVMDDEMVREYLPAGLQYLPRDGRDL